MTPSRTSTKTLRRSPREAWRKLRPFLGDSTRGIVALGATAVVGGFVEAGGDGDHRPHRGGAGQRRRHRLGAPRAASARSTMTIGQLFALAFGLLVVRLLFNTVNSWLTSRLSVEALTAARKRTFSDFVRASWPVQSVERDGHLQEIMSTHVGRVSQATLTLANTTVAGVQLPRPDGVGLPGQPPGVGADRRRRRHPVLRPAAHDPGGPAALEGQQRGQHRLRRLASPRA